MQSVMAPVAVLNDARWVRYTPQAALAAACTLATPMRPLVALVLLVAAACRGAEPTIDFVRDVQPILRQHCWSCHGPEKQRGNLRLDSRELALAGGKLGKAIVPGAAAASLLVQRIATADADERMPAKAAALPPAQVQILRAWVEQGAVWPEAASVAGATLKRHWAWQAPARPAPPAVKAATRNPIDAFIAERLARDGLALSAEADRPTLIRRLSLDLIGLPPTPEEVAAFVADAGADAYDRVVERVLASPHFGERWARPWLDLARYADTNGYEKDGRRTMWPWRDWVIDALNRDLPYDQFTIEQLAGDLLPGATTAQRVATGFHRNTMVNDEGGIDKAEYRWYALIDRATTTAAVWMGATIGCAQCHNHKFDPFTQKEFFAFLAFFESAEELNIAVPPPPADLKRRQGLERELAQARAALAAATPAADADQPAWEAAQAGATDKLPKPVREALAKPAASRDAKAREVIAEHHRGLHAATSAASARIAALTRQLAEKAASAMVFQEKANAVAQTRFHARGMWLNQGEMVPAGVPAVLPPLPAGAPPTRLALARWLVSGQHPLTARVAVNRVWETCFGRGLLETSEDFGTQAPSPSHPELLDWLAEEFVARGWSLKALLRLIAGSATYRQQAALATAARERDPQNRLLGRSPRHRLEAELVRDNALAAAGLLDRTIGGPSVFPPQPDGIWNLPYNGDRWVTSAGGDRHRRGIYTFVRRSAPYPFMASFDAPSREACTVRRPRSNTPLQALNLLNDPVFVEAARALARRMQAEAGPDDAARIAHGFRLCVARAPTAAEQARLLALKAGEQARLRGDAVAAATLASDAAGGDPVAGAAWVLVANVLLNLDEFVTRE